LASDAKCTTEGRQGGARKDQLLKRETVELRKREGHGFLLERGPRKEERKHLYVSAAEEE